jgi:FixJ family two-component response regulator
MPGSPATIHVIDDDAPVREGLGRLLRGMGYDVCIYENADRFLTTNVEPKRGCILLDIEMPGLSGPELQERLIASNSPIPIIFLTGHGDLPSSVRAVKAGAEDFLAKPAPSDVLADAIKRALERYDETELRASQQRKQRDLLSRLTPRELEVLRHVVAGKMNKQIAFRIGASERTVKAHRHNVMQKLEVESVAELVLLADSLGIGQPESEA